METAENECHEDGKKQQDESTKKVESSILVDFWGYKGVEPYLGDVEIANLSVTNAEFVGDTDDEFIKIDVAADVTPLGDD